ncbi:outer membrane MltA-interaction protein MipA [Thalassotalea insulae]|uniref:Outer membrane MltA-interaction protein MipA n=1 Tax=Thalassotalea insulae TaxID=2056778 RepID=A0ABQ6GQ12_9GAMM|nr:outer membrane MltA-interaction protein MipA [Thalassotalea insulae]
MPVGDWQFSLALGIGELSNPLQGGDDIPLLILPYINYYGEQFFIENNVIGYSFYQSDQLVLSAIGQLNREKAFFTDWQPSHLFVPNFSDSMLTESDHKTISKDDVSKRKWAVDGGIQLNWFINQSTELKVQLLHDINQVYQGLNSQLALYHRINISDNAQLNLGIGANWHSAKLNDYYYGLDEKDQVGLSNYYQAEGGINPFVSLGFYYQLTSKWQAQIRFKQQRLSRKITDSPLVKDQQVTSAFIGVVYAF